MRKRRSRGPFFWAASAKRSSNSALPRSPMAWTATCKPARSAVTDVLRSLLQGSHVDAGAARFIKVGFEHLGGGGAERTVDEIFQGADLDPEVAEADEDADLGETRPGAEGKLKPACAGSACRSWKALAGGARA